MPARSAGKGERWTDETIEAELRKLCQDRNTWPTLSEFRAAGQGALYYAASRNRGIRYWRDTLGL